MNVEIFKAMKTAHANARVQAAKIVAFKDCCDRGKLSFHRRIPNMVSHA